MSITQAIINTYGKEQLRAAFLQAGSKEGAKNIFISLLKRDAPNVLKHYKWGGLQNSLNGLLNQIGVVY